ncbi:hypothetical protein N752_21445 [Desulforamulus aquiferis]|nr:hypothetical protein [Desulforamulus aquiferis]RYD02980.1 hypothetical protein N752_21445 [Desulforamulus aquiferis]
MGLALSELIENRELQIDIFNVRQKNEQIDKALDVIRSRWGAGSIKRAVSLTEQGVYYGRKS